MLHKSMMLARYASDSSDSVASIQLYDSAIATIIWPHGQYCLTAVKFATFLLLRGDCLLTCFRLTATGLR